MAAQNKNNGPVSKKRFLANLAESNGDNLNESMTSNVQKKPLLEDNDNNTSMNITYEEE